ncbi:ATP-dependent zinc metalloprotease FTSH 5, mitochondrial [Hordeum vulgare]|nr:ATP-dependent zinc metalloprotease FTSH 5, mitochondrial [Hordeum vulgare]
MDALSDDSGWSSSDDSNIEDLLQDDDIKMMGLLLDVKEFEDRVKLMDQRRGSKMGRVTIYQNRCLGHEHLMRDYFAEGTTNTDEVASFLGTGMAEHGNKSGEQDKKRPRLTDKAEGSGAKKSSIVR